jgi:hypothetical protein
MKNDGATGLPETGSAWVDADWSEPQAARPSRQLEAQCALQVLR